MKREDASNGNTQVKKRNVIFVLKYLVTLHHAVRACTDTVLRWMNDGVSSCRDHVVYVYVCCVCYSGFICSGVWFCVSVMQLVTCGRDVCVGDDEEKMSVARRRGRWELMRMWGLLLVCDEAPELLHPFELLVLKYFYLLPLHYISEVTGTFYSTTFI